MLFNDERWIGGTWYNIVFKDGTYHIIEDEQPYDYEDSAKIIFTGKYTDCVDKLNEIEISYKESLF